MKKPVILIISQLLLFASCSNTDFELQEKNGINTHNVASATTVSDMTTNVAIGYYRQEELYICSESKLKPVDNVEGSPFGRILVSWPDSPANIPAMASCGGFIYVVHNDQMYKVSPGEGFDVDPFNGQPFAFTPYDTWANTAAMTSNPNTKILYVIQDNALWKVTTSNAVVSKLGNETWENTAAMTYEASATGKLFVIQDDKLWKADINTGVASLVGVDTWHNTAAMTSTGGYIYVIQDDLLWKVSPIFGTASVLGTETWANTRAMTVYNGDLYVVQDGSLWKASTSTGAATHIATGWGPTTQSMTAFQP